MTRKQEEKEEEEEEDEEEEEPREEGRKKERKKERSSLVGYPVLLDCLLASFYRVYRVLFRFYWALPSFTELFLSSLLGFP